MAARAVNPPANLPELVATAFAKARANNDLHYFPTQVTLLPVGSVPFQLRFSPALANKPKGPPSDAARSQKPFDPFAHPPPSLFIADLGPSHYLVLNKFAVVPGHFILATRTYKEQTHVLETSDLEATLACIEAYEDDTREDDDGLFAFFNCGEHSGASQPHRHIQLLPIDGMRDGLGAGSRWEVLADGEQLDQAPFVVFSEAIWLGMPAAELFAAYLRLYRQACRAVEARNGDVPVEGPARISYNMALTRNKLVICPRLAEGGPVCGESGEEVGRLALNGTLLAGTALVKNEAEWEALRARPRGLVEVLGTVGLQREGVDDGRL